MGVISYGWIIIPYSSNGVLFLDRLFLVEVDFLGLRLNRELAQSKGLDCKGSY